MRNLLRELAFVVYSRFGVLIGGGDAGYPKGGTTRDDLAPGKRTKYIYIEIDSIFG